MNYYDLFISFFILLILYFFFKKKNFLQDNIDYSDHKKIGIHNKSPIVLGGIYITLSFFILVTEEYNFLKYICIIVLILGLLSDKNFLPNPFIRLILQIIILFVLIFFEELDIKSISIDYIDELLSIRLFNIFFTLFCFAVLINGSNFLDGLNGLLSGYYLLVLSSFLYIGIFSYDVQLDSLKLVFTVLSILLIFFIFNIFGVVYLGDSGSYIISLIVGYLLINGHQQNIYISPYYIVLTLWYPAFENLFSLIRRLYNKNNVSSADKLHLHQLIYRYFGLKKIIGKTKLNTFTSFTILIFNLPIFIIASLNYSHTSTLVSIIIINVIFYLFLYLYLVRKLSVKNSN